MPLIKKVLETKILLALQKLSTTNLDTKSAQKELAKELASAFDSYIKSATIITPSGQILLAGPYPGTTTTPSPPAKVT